MTTPARAVIINHLASTGLLPVFQHHDAETWMNVIKCAYRNGIRVIEFVHQRNTRSIRLFAQIHAVCSFRYPQLLIGAGNVFDASTADQYIQAGAQFISSPLLHEEVANCCTHNNILWIPGSCSKEDASRAQELDAMLVSIMPANIVQPAFLSVLQEQFPGLNFIPSGLMDLSEKNIRQWFETGAMCLRIVSPLFPKESIAIKDWVKIEQQIITTRTVISLVRKSIQKEKNLVS